MLFAAEEEERLRNADRLMGTEQRCHVAAPTAKQHRSAAIVCLRKPQSAVFHGNLDSEGPKPGKTVNDRIGDLTALIDLIRIRVISEKPFQPVQKGVTLISILSGLLGKGRDLREVVSPEK